jgi:Down syndrome cell adhesion molecule-like protein 1
LWKKQFFLIGKFSIIEFFLFADGNYSFMIGQYVTAHGDVIAHVNISRVMVEDGGEYSCIVENRAGRTSHSARLNVYGTPYIRLIPKVTAVAGEALHLKCPVAGYPIEEIHWERNGRELPDDIRQKVQTDGSLVISPVQKKDDSGTYTCWARNKQGLSARRSGEVSVIGGLNVLNVILFQLKFRINQELPELTSKC